MQLAIVAIVAIVATSCVAPFREEAKEPIELEFDILAPAEPSASSGTIEFSQADTDLLGLDSSTISFDFIASSSGGEDVQLGLTSIPTGYLYSPSSDGLVGDPGNPCLQSDVHAITNVDPKPRVIIPAGFCFGDSRFDITWIIYVDMRNNTLRFSTDPPITVQQN